MPQPPFHFPLPGEKPLLQEERFVERRRHLNTFFLPVSEMEGGFEVTKIYLGEHLISPNEKDIIETMLGACVAVCLRDTMTGIAAMCHYLLPASLSRHTSLKHAGRYGATILPQLLKQMQMQGVRTSKMEAKIFGGAVFSNELIAVGEDNIACAQHFLQTHSIPIVGMDCGGEWPRHVQFRVKDGIVRVRKLKRFSDFAIAHAEQAIAHALTRTSARPVR